MAKPMLVQLETQGRLTLALLPLVAALPFVDDKALVRVFGQTMSVLNWVRSNHSTMEFPAQLTLSESQLVRRTPRTKEEQRRYQRDAQRARRRRLKIEVLERERSAIEERIAQLRGPTIGLINGT